MAVRDLKERGVDFIKVHDGTPREAFFAIADEAPRLGLSFAGHVPAAVTVEEAADAGIKSIEHFANFRVFNDCSAKRAAERHPLPGALRQARGEGRVADTDDGFLSSHSGHVLRRTTTPR